MTLCFAPAGTITAVPSFTLLSLPSITTFPSPNPLILKVLGQGTNIVNETDIVLSGFSKTQTVTVTSSGEVR